MESIVIGGSSSRRLMLISSSKVNCSSSLIPSMATFFTTRTAIPYKKVMKISAAGKPPGTRQGKTESGRVKLLTRVEKLRLLTKAEKAGLLSSAEKFGLSLSSIEKLGLLSKAEELGVLSAATDPGTPASLQTLAIALLLVGPLSAYFVPDDYPWEIVLQFSVALLCVLGGSAAFAASNFVSNLQKSS